MDVRFDFRQRMPFSSKRQWCALLGAVLLLAPPNAQATTPARHAAQIIVVQGAESEASRELLAGFTHRLARVGRSPEVTIVPADKPSIEKALGAPAHLILALGSQATELAMGSRRGVPVISTMVARESSWPQTNAPATVVLEFTPEVEMLWMHRILPGVRRVGVMFSSEDNARLIERARQAADILGMEIIARRITDPRAIPSTLSSLTGSADVLWGIADDVVLTPETAKAVLLASLRNRVPFVGLSTSWVRSGAVYALDRDYRDLGEQVADVAVRILDGASTQSIRVQRPRLVRVALSERSANLMKLKFPAEISRNAAEVIR